MSYPNTIDDFVSKTDGLDTVHAQDVNELQTAIGAIETELGTNPRGNYSSIKSAIDNFSYAAFAVEVFGPLITWTTGDGKVYTKIPPKLNGYNVVSVSMSCLKSSTSGIPTIQIARGRQPGATAAYVFTDILNPKLTIDLNEYDSKFATTAAAVDTNYDDLATGDLLRFDSDVGNNAMGCWVVVTCRKP